MVFVSVFEIYPVNLVGFHGLAVGPWMKSIGCILSGCMFLLLSIINPDRRPNRFPSSPQQYPARDDLPRGFLLCHEFAPSVYFSNYLV